MRTLDRSPLLVILGAALALAACGTPSPRGGALDGLPSGSDWQLESMDGAPLVEGSVITLEAGDGGPGGFGGCNAYGGRLVSGSDGTFAVTDIASTAAACGEPPGVMQQEQTYLRRLGEVSSARLDGERLVLESPEKPEALVYRRLPPSTGDPASLIGRAWRLESFDGMAPRGTYTVAFPEEGVAVGRAGCRAWVGGYSAAAGRLGFQSLSMAGEPCDSLRTEEGSLTDALGGTARYSIDDDAWELRTPGGRVLRFGANDPPSASLEGGAWELLGLSGDGDSGLILETVPEGAGVTLRVDDGSLEGSAGCNSYGGDWSGERGSVGVERLYWTEMHCAGQGVMDREERYLALLGSVSSATVTDGLLWLGAPAGGLLFRRR